MARRRSDIQEIPWPIKGICEGLGYESQRSGTSADLLNVRNYDPTTGRQRGAQRAGHARYPNAQISDNPIQCIEQLTYADTGAASQTAVRARLTKNLAICNGVIKSFTGTAFAATTGTPTISTLAPLILGAQMFGVMYFCDGTNYFKYTLSTDTGAVWAASPGTLPSSGANVARLICNWGGRIVLSGIVGDEHNWHMSKRDNAGDWDTAPASTTATQAVSGNSAEAGKCPDIITSLCPFSDDILIFGGDHSIWQMTGDPMVGGSLDRLSDTVGMAWGKPWAKDAQGVIYFFGSRGGVYRLLPNTMPEDITLDDLHETLAATNLDTHLVRMLWDDRTKGLHVYITALADQTASTHWYWCSRTDSWWKDSFANHDINPRAVAVLDGDLVADRVAVLGGRDGRIRQISYAADDDDASAINSYVFLGPLSAEDARITLHGLQAVLSDTSNAVTYSVHVGNNAKAALGAAALWSDTFATAGKNYWNRLSAAGHAVYIKLGNSANNEKWALEKLYGMMRVSDFGSRLLV